MPKSKEITNDEAIVKLYREFLKLVDPAKLGIAENLAGDELKDFVKFCHQTVHNPFFDKIIRGFVFDQVMMTAQAGITADQYMNGKLMIAGLFSLQEYYLKQANKFDQMNQKEVDFDPQASFSSAKI